MRKVMIVDDEAIARRGLRHAIPWERLGYAVTAEAANGKAALEKADGFDVIFTDITMPVMDGIELIRELNARKNPAKVVILSCHEDFDYAREAIRLGAVDYLLKHTYTPKDVQSLLEKLDEVFHREATREKSEESHRRDAMTCLVKGRMDAEERVQLEEMGILPGGPGTLYLLLLRFADKEARDGETAGRILAGVLAPPPARELWRLELDPITQGLIVRFEAGCGEAAARDGIRRFYGELQGLLGERGLSFSFSRSSPRAAWSELAAAYQEALEGFERSMDFDECNQKVKAAIDFIKQSYARPITLADIAEHVYVSRIYLSQLFKKETGMNISRYLLEHRLETAKRLLVGSNLKIYVIAEMVGFGSAQYFSQIFKRETGMNPADYKEQTPREA